MWEELANAVIISACKDYIYWYGVYLKCPYERHYTYKLQSLERFFTSDYFSFLTTIDGTYLMRECRKKAVKKYQKRRG